MPRRVPRPPSQLPVMVVGGGIGGLAMAHWIRKANPTAQVELFEASEDWGGRVAVGDLLGAPLPLGAMRFHRLRHPRTLSLLEELHIQAVAWPYRLRRSVLAQRGLELRAEEALRLLDSPGTSPQLARDLSGYGFAFSGPQAFRREQILRLPEFAPEGWLVPSDGFREIIDRLVAEVSCSVPLHRGWRLVAVDRMAEGTDLKLTFRSAQRVIERRAQQVALCVGPATLCRIDGTQACGLARIARAIKTVPKFRAWLRVSRPVCELVRCEDFAVIISDDLCRKIYLSGKYAMVYCDGEHAQGLNGLLSETGDGAAQALLDRLLCGLTADKKGARSDGAIWRYWEDGIHFSLLPDEEKRLVNDLGSVSVVDEAFSDYPGFIEGVLQESERIAARVVARYRIC